MRYKSRNYFIDALKAETLAKKYSTPLYCYSLQKLRNNIINFKKSFKQLIQLSVLLSKQTQIEQY